MPKYADINSTRLQLQPVGLQTPDVHSSLSQYRIKILTIFAVILLTNITGADPAYAQNLEGLANRMLSLLSGGLMRTLATIAVIALGAAWWVGRVDGAKAFAIAFGIVIVFAAPFIVTTISGG